MFKTDKSTHNAVKNFVYFQDNKSGFLFVEDVKSTDKANEINISRPYTINFVCTGAPLAYIFCFFRVKGGNFFVAYCVTPTDFYIKLFRCQLFQTRTQRNAQVSSAYNHHKLNF